MELFQLYKIMSHKDLTMRELLAYLKEHTAAKGETATKDDLIALRARWE